MIPINNNYLSVNAKDIVDKHDHLGSMYKWNNEENQKRMTTQQLVLHLDPIHHGMRKVPSSIKLMSIHKDKWLAYIVMPIHDVYSLPRVMLQCLHQEIYMTPNNIGYKHIHGAIEYRMRLYFLTNMKIDTNKLNNTLYVCYNILDTICMLQYNVFGHQTMILSISNSH